MFHRLLARAARPGVLAAAAGRPRLLAAGASAAATSLAAGVSSSPSACASTGGGLGMPTPSTLGLPTSMSDVSALQLEVFGVSGLTGYTAGYAVKRTFRVAVFTAGTIFIGLQALASNGLIEIKWEEVDRRWKALVDENDLQRGQTQVEAYLSAGLPSAGAFSAGFLMGLRS